MNIDSLMSSLEYVLKEATKTLQLPDVNGNLVAPKVVRGYLPPKDPEIEGKDESDSPCVIARFLSDDADEDGTTAQVKVICIVYSEDDAQGWRELLTIMNPLQTYFLTHRNIGGCFSVKLPIKREIPEEQDPPEWIGTMTLTIETPQAQEVNDDGGIRDFLAGQ